MLRQAGRVTSRILWEQQSPLPTNAARTQPWKLLFRAASSTSTSADRSKNARTDHDLRVAAAQALVRQRRQHRQQAKTLANDESMEAPSLQNQQSSQQQQLPKSSSSHSQPQSTPALQDPNVWSPTLDAATRHILANNIQHWFSKDASFFTSTMQALNLNLLGSSDTSAGVSHPLQTVLNQYRQLYYESISDFRHYVEAEPESLSPVLHQLSKGGFGDVHHSKRFRQLRSYQLRKDQVMVQVAKQQTELDRRTQMLLDARQELESLQVLVRTLERKHAEKQTKRQKEQQALTEAAQPRSDATKEVFAKILSDVLPSHDATDNGDVTVSSKEDDASASARIPKSLLKRIQRKQETVRDLQRNVDAVQERLTKAQSQKQGMQAPMPPQELEQATQAIQRAREVLCQELASRIQTRHAQLIEQYQTLDAKTDLTKPQEWFGYARLDRRKIIFHGGPTNSGKTYNALLRLKDAKKGLYLGPLRLLAAEIYDDLTADGLYTDLFTGQERREIAFSTHASGTVEMVNLNQEYDVVVIDEIQMISDITRGAAWTKALLGLRCKEIHVCGGLEARNVVEKLARACGDEFELNEYERFSPLVVAPRSLSKDPSKPGGYRFVQPGDCVVAFSRNDIFAIKREIESVTNYKCCVIYGKLPPQTRADQARRFNDPNSGYDILVASDAIGMGLNLNIRRIIFNTVYKYNGERVAKLSHSEIKQIAGRAGRRNSPFPHGEVTCRDPRDLSYIKECLSTDIVPIEKAAILPTAEHIELFSEGLQAYGGDNEEMDLYKIFKQFSAMATVKGDFFLGRQTEMRLIAKKLKGIPIQLRDAYSMCLSPTSENSLPLLQNFAWKLCRGEVFGLPSRSVPKQAKSFDDLSYLCGIYADADLFLWLQFKFPPGNAVEHQAALARKEKTLEFINEALANTEHLRLDHDYIRMAERNRTRYEAENPSSAMDTTFVDTSNGTADEYDSDHEDDDDDEDFRSILKA
eukprot:Nitzschia sp. Nitz4//scaffold46_size129759//62121//65060//NITZ4_003504-RA/size129759-processed-gene-0.161-mRNA-1//-1//CDS//3329552604//3547//frame0